MRTRILTIDPHEPQVDLIIEAARCVHQGGVIVFPTETVYGIAADAANPVAMSRLRTIKRRSDHKPFSVMIAQKELIRNYTTYSDPRLFKLVDKYWPGPLTVIVPVAEKGCTIGIRIPDHLVALKLVENSHCTIAAPSANFEGSPPPATCQEALQELDGLVDMAIDSGRVNFGTASTIVDFSAEEPVVVREGVISAQEVSDTTKRKNVLFVCTGNSCRSVMAEFLFKKMIAEHKNIDVSSAGTSVLFPTSASHDSLNVLARYNIDARAHISRPVSNMLLKKADLIIVMTRSHRQQVLERVPSVEQRVYLLGEFQNRAIRLESDLDIPDPMGHSRARYEECAATIKDCLQKVVRIVT